MDRVFLKLGPINIYCYAIIILIGIIIAYLVASIEAKRQKLDKNFLTDLLFYLVPIGIIGARLYYVLFDLDNFIQDPLSIIKIWEGGLAIYGAVIACIIFIYFYSKKIKMSFLRILDLLAPSLIIAQSIGRWGNFVNQEAYGPLTTLEHLKDLHLPNFIIEGMHINGAYYTPTFLYESLWCLVGFIILMLIRYLIKNKNEGTLTSIYFIWYGIGRFLIEGLRQDSLYLGPLRISQVVSIILIIIGIAILIIMKVRKKNAKV